MRMNVADTTKKKPRYYTGMSDQFCGLGILNSSMTLYELVTLIARKTPLTSRQIEERLLTSINDMLDSREQNA